jgi:hypothetical protein
VVGRYARHSGSNWPGCRRDGSLRVGCMFTIGGSEVPMATKPINYPTTAGQESRYLGNIPIWKMILLILISILAWALAVLLFLALRPARLSYPFTVLAYAFPVFHLMPWAAGMLSLRKIRGQSRAKAIEPAAAALARSIVTGLLSATYVVLCYGELMTILTYKLQGLRLPGCL